MSRHEQGHPVFEVAIAGRLTWNLHSLNNEGTLGNVSEPRTVVLWDGHKTDGVSGEMMKHIHAQWTWLGALSGEKHTLCEGCRDFRPQRADLRSRDLDRKDNAKALAQALECTLCDIHGFLVQTPTIHRQSVVEFGWVVGVPGRVHRDLHTHARHAATERGIETNQDSGTEASGEGAAREGAAAQMVYHRPTRSGVYAFLSLFQPWRIGLNEISYTYAVTGDERKRRYELAIQAYEWTIKRPDGAMRSTRLPHIEAAEGIVVYSTQPIPVPLLTPIREDYREKLETIATMQGCAVARFNDIDGLVQILQELKQLWPLELQKRKSD